MAVVGPDLVVVFSAGDHDCPVLHWLMAQMARDLRSSHAQVMLLIPSVVSATLSGASQSPQDEGEAPHRTTTSLLGLVYAWANGGRSDQPPFCGILSCRPCPGLSVARCTVCLSNKAANVRPGWEQDSHNHIKVTQGNPVASASKSRTTATGQDDPRRISHTQSRATSAGSGSKNASG